MKEFYIDAGELREHITILKFQEISSGNWGWVPLSRRKASVEQGNGKNLFSSVGIGARDVKIILRRQELSPHQAILWKGQHIFISSVLPKGRQHIEVSAAMVAVVQCKGETFKSKLGPGNRPIREKDGEIRFPGILTEKYVGYEREASHATASVTYVLVTPKVVKLSEGDLVTISEGNSSGVYNIQKSHRLDDYKNEYEIAFSHDV